MKPQTCPGRFPHRDVACGLGVPPGVLLCEERPDPVVLVPDARADPRVGIVGVHDHLSRLLGRQLPGLRVLHATLGRQPSSSFRGSLRVQHRFNSGSKRETLHVSRISKPPNSERPNLPTTIA
jgi:hypothetical protein